MLLFYGRDGKPVPRPMTASSEAASLTPVLT